MRAVNLLTPELRSAQKGSGAPRPSAMETKGGLGAFIVLGVLALVVAGVAGSVLASNVVKDRKATLAQVSAKNDATVKRAAELKPYADFQTLAQERAATVQALASARFDWEQSMRDLSRALPSNVYLSSLKGTVGGASAGGGSGSGLRSAIGDRARHRALRLHQEPARRRDADVAPAQRPGRHPRQPLQVREGQRRGRRRQRRRRHAVGPCGKGSPPSFEMVVFFEKAAVAGALATATGEVAAPGAAGAAAPAADATGKGTDDSSAKRFVHPRAHPRRLIP